MESARIKSISELSGIRQSLVGKLILSPKERKEKKIKEIKTKFGLSHGKGKRKKKKKK